MPYEIATEQPEVKLRQLAESDAQALFALIDSSREHLSQFGDDTAKKYPDLESVRESIRNPPMPNKLRFGVWDGLTLVGSANLIPAGNAAIVGYWIGANFLRKGYATLSVKALCAFATREFKYRSFLAQVHMENLASRKVLEKCGFASEGFAPTRSAFEPDGPGRSEVILVYRCVRK